jgi:hypothetical protein
MWTYRINRRSIFLLSFVLLPGYGFVCFKSPVHQTYLVLVNKNWVIQSSSRYGSLCSRWCPLYGAQSCLNMGLRTAGRGWRRSLSSTATVKGLVWTVRSVLIEPRVPALLRCHNPYKIQCMFALNARALTPMRPLRLRILAWRARQPIVELVGFSARGVSPKTLGCRWQLDLWQFVLLLRGQFNK